MTWIEICADLSELVDDLEGPVKALEAKIQVSDLVAAEQRERKAVDEACSHFAQHGNWPKATQQQAAFAFLRLEYARLFAQLLAREGKAIFANHQMDQPKQTIFRRHPACGPRRRWI